MSRPIDRFARLAEPIRTSASSTTITFEWTFTKPPPGSAGYTTASRPYRSASRSRRTIRARSTPIVCSSSQPLATFGTTSTTSGPSGSRSRAASASASHSRRDVLVLEVDRAARGADRVEVERRDLAAPRPVAERGHRAREARAHVVEVGLELVRPRVGAGLRGRDALAGRGTPPLARQLAERSRGRAVDRDADVVERRVVEEAGVAAARVGHPVLARVPAARGEVEAAREGDRVVDDDELLVVTAARRMDRVESEVQAAVRAAPEADARQHLTLEREEHREVPLEDVDLEIAPPPHEAVEERHEVARLVAAAETHPGVEVPSDQENALAGSLHGVRDGAEVALAVDQERRARGRLAAPAVAPRREDPRRSFVMGGRA